MCKCNCEQPELKPKDGKCSEEQIKECHGDVESNYKKIVTINDRIRRRRIWIMEIT